MFQKYAKADVLEVKRSSTKINGLQKFASHSDSDYVADNGYLYVRVRAISSRVNANFDGWPSDELARSYKSFMHRPIFVDHNNSDPKRTRGIIVDSQLHVEDEHKVSAVDPYYKTAAANHKPPTWVELLLEIDAQSFPKLAKAIIDGDIDSVSMGANVAKTSCSVCGNEASNASQFCSHVQHKGAYYDTYQDGHRTSKLAYEDCADFDFFEISAVFTPADETALIDRDSIRQSSIMEDEADRVIEAMGVPLWFADLIPAIGLGTAFTAGQSQELWNKYKDQYGTTPAPAKTVMQAIKSFIPGLSGDTDKMHKSEPGPFNREASLKTAENDAPREEAIKAPTKVNTLRQEGTCRLCGSEVRDGQCTVCKWEEPPAGLNNPDLDQAKKVDKKLQEQQALMEIKRRRQERPKDLAGSDDVKEERQSMWHKANVNPIEKVALPPTQAVSDQPKKTRTVKDSVKPVESKMEKSSDSTSPDAVVDVEGTGTALKDKEPTSESVEKAVEVSGEHTDTWGIDEGNSLGQAEGVTTESMPSKGASTKTALEVLNTEPQKLDLEAEVSDEVGPATTTWSDGGGTDPVTSEEGVGGGPIGDSASKSSHVFSALKVAELEAELGLLPSDEKYERAAKLEGNTPEAIEARLETLSSIKTAGLVRTASARPAGTARVPSFRTASAGFVGQGLGDDETSQLFL